MVQGKYATIVVCWLIGNGCLFSWNSMLTIEDYCIYFFVFLLVQKYHPSRLLTLVYQPFAIGTLAILAYNEAKLNTRIRNIGDFGVADAYVQGGMVGDLSYMKLEFIQSFLAGVAASDALTSALRLITKTTFENSKDVLCKGASKFNSPVLLIFHSMNTFMLMWLIEYYITDHLSSYTIHAVLFFAISTFFELLSVVLYAFIFPKIPIVKYYHSKAASEGSKTVSADLAARGIRTLPGAIMLFTFFFSFQ
ncbi:Equilibrative nucleotide transporter 3 [Glycine soja]